LRTAEKIRHARVWRAWEATAWKPTGRTADLIAADRPFYLLIGLYVGVVFTFALSLGQTANAQFLSYLGPLLILAGSLALCARFALALIAAIKTNPASPLRPMLRNLRAAPKPHIVSGLLFCAGIALLLGAFTTMKNMLPLLHAFSSDEQLADIDRKLHFGYDAWTLFRSFYGAATLTGAEILYSIAWGSGTTLFTLFMALFCADRQLRARFFLTYIMSWILLGNVVASVFLSGGPAFYHHFVADAGRFAELRAYLGTGSDSPISAAALQSYLWELHRTGRAALGSGISAFPSLHVGIASLCAITAWRLDWRLGIAAWAFAVLTLIDTVFLGWHYAIGGYVPMLAVAALWTIAGRIVEERPRPVFAASTVAGLDTRGLVLTSARQASLGTTTHAFSGGNTAPA
jgi:hypothetical protein